MRTEIMLPQLVISPHHAPTRLCSCTSYNAGFRWYAWQDSNLRPFGPQPNALSSELQARGSTYGTAR